MGISDMIAGFIQEILDEQDSAELQRADLAQQFGCVPSQINYVISTRFSPEHGYIVESRRGGGGYIRISRVRTDPKLIIMHTMSRVGNAIDLKSANALISNAHYAGVLDERTARLMASAISDAALRPLAPEKRDEVRATIFKQLLANAL